VSSHFFFLEHPMKTSVELNLNKSTKGTHVFSNEEHGLNLYFPKALFPKPEEPPTKLKMTLEAAK
jgi:hypothetical protein